MTATLLANPFDTVTGLPLHPLVVHLTVVLLPLSAVAMILLVLVPRLRVRYASITAVLAIVGGVSALVAKESGEALAHRVGEPGQHAQYGDWLGAAGPGFALLVAAWYLAQRMSRSRETGAGAVLALGVVTAAAAVAVIVLTVLAGHSGAERVWADTVASAGLAAPAPTT